MKKVIVKRIIKITVVIAALLAVLLFLSGIYRPKYYFMSGLRSPETEMWDEFYSEKRDSLDAVFVGSSHVYNGVSPAEIYERAGVASYDLSTSAQNLPTGYYVLKECFRYQKPKYVFLDANGFFKSNITIDNYERTFDDMKWSINKLQAIDESIKMLPYAEDAGDKADKSYFSLMLGRVFPVLDFHSRWDEMETIDFDASDFRSILKGYCADSKSEPVVKGEYYTDSPVWLSEATEQWFSKIKSLCDENGATLVVICVPYVNWNSAKWNAVNDLVGRYAVPFIDFNMPDIYQMIGLDENTDYINEEHLNIYGAKKLSDFIADSIFNSGVCAVDKKGDSANWDKAANTWRVNCKKANLLNAVRLPEYMEMLKDSDYVVMFTVNAGADFDPAVTDEITSCMAGLGVSYPTASGEDYILSGIAGGGQQIDMSLSNGKEDSVRSEYSIDGARFCAVVNPDSPAKLNTSVFGPGSSIVINDKNYSVGGDELNMVVYSISEKKVVDSVYVDISYTLNIAR